jgi:hypothetical protein
MKQFITLLLPLLLLAGTLPAQQQNSLIERHTLNIGSASGNTLALAVKNYRMGLESENDGLVESSLYYAVCLRLKFPDKDFRTLENAIDDLVTRGATETIRFKAYLASTVYASPELIECDRLPEDGDTPAFFANLGNQLQQRLLVYNK